MKRFGMEFTHFKEFGLNDVTRSVKGVSERIISKDSSD